MIGIAFCKVSSVDDWKSAKSSSSNDAKTVGGTGLAGGGMTGGSDDGALGGGNDIGVCPREATGGNPKDAPGAGLALAAFGYSNASGTPEVGVLGMVLGFRLSALVSWDPVDNGEVGEDVLDGGGGMPINAGTLGRGRLAAWARPDGGLEGGEEVEGVCERDDGGGGIMNDCGCF